MSISPAADRVLRSWCCWPGRPNRCRPALIGATWGCRGRPPTGCSATLVEHGFVSYLPRSVGTGSAWSRSSSARPTRGRCRCGGSPSRCCTDSSTGAAERPPRRAARPRRLLRDRGAGPGPPAVGHRRGRPVAGHAHRLRAGHLAGLPAFAGACALPERGRVRRSARGPATPTAHRRLLSDVRNRGYSTEEGTVTPGLSSVAQIVVDHVGYPTAAVAVTYLTDGGRPSDPRWRWSPRSARPLRTSCRDGGPGCRARGGVG